MLFTHVLVSGFFFFGGGVTVEEDLHLTVVSLERIRCSGQETDSRCQNVSLLSTVSSTSSTDRVGYRKATLSRVATSENKGVFFLYIFVLCLCSLLNLLPVSQTMWFYQVPFPQTCSVRETQHVT